MDRFFYFSALMLAVVNDVAAFGKYLQAHHSKMNKDEDRDNDEGKEFASGRSDVEEAEFRPHREISMEIEVIAALLIAGIFALFIITYVVFLQCWWRFSDMRKRKKGLSGVGSDRIDSSDHCACFAQHAWEPIDLEKCIRLAEEEAVAAATSANNNNNNNNDKEDR